MTTTRAHGTTSRYKHGCRCPDCCKANRAYDNHRSRQIAYGRWQPYLDAEPVRQHVRMLGDCGIGWKRVAELAGVSRGAVSKLLYGLKGRAPSRRMRRESAEKILAVRFDIDALPDTARVASAGSRRRVQALALVGWSIPLQGRLIGAGRNTLYEVLNQPYVCAGTARAIRDLANRLWNQTPPDSTHGERLSVAKARAYAHRNGWLPLAAWDDDLIDLPDEWLAKAITEQVAGMGRAELAAAWTAHYKHGDKSPLTVAAARYCKRVRKAEALAARAEVAA